MKVNEHVALLTPKVLLVPYSKSHVLAYHEWMKDEELQQATASEPLTLDQEYEMQQSWRIDDDKLTFIACTAPVLPQGGMQEVHATGIRSTEFDGPAQMIGDVNLFVTEADQSDDHNAQGRKENNLVGELEVMIARKDIQGQGYGRNILLAFLWYILVHLEKESAEQWRLHLRTLRVKIDKDNVRSIRLFKSVGFTLMSEVPNYFGELELTWDVGAQSAVQLEEKLKVSCSDWQDPHVLAYR